MSGTTLPTSFVPHKSSNKKSTGESPTEFQFLNFSHPSEAKDQRARRTVRSHVTRQQHQKEQQAAAVSTRRSNSVPQPFPEPQQQRETGMRVHAASFPTARPSMIVQHYSPPSGSRFTSISPVSPTTPSSPFNSLGQLDPLMIYPVSWHPYIPTIFDTYLFSMAHDFLNAGDSATTDLLRLQWMPFVMTDIALLHATLLVAATLFGSPPGPRRHTIDLIQLRGMAMGAINDALQDQFRSVSDQIIGAVATMAQYEAFWGENDPESKAYQLHMQGLVHLVRNKGGLPSLGLNGLLQKLLLAIDYHASRSTGIEVFFSNTSSALGMG